MRTLHRVDPGDQYQCTSVGAGGQCCYMSMKGLVETGKMEDPEYIFREVLTCPRHNGNASANRIRKQRVDMYRLHQWQERINELAEHEEVKTLRSEVGILRLLIEQTMSQCKDTNDLMMYSSRISMMLGQCEKLVRSCERLEDRAGIMLDKAAAIAFAHKIVEIVAQEVTDPDVIDTISQRVITALGEVTNGD